MSCMSLLNKCLYTNCKIRFLEENQEDEVAESKNKAVNVKFSFIVTWYYLSLDFSNPNNKILPRNLEIFYITKN
jgi:hypothetical protein